MKRHLLFLLISCVMTGCWSWEPKELKPLPTAAFTVSNDGCTVGCTITFTNTSLNATSYQWEFGDNTTSTQASPTKQFATANTYTVKLTATGKGGSNTTQQTVTVKAQIVPPPVAAFTIINNNCTAPCSVTFNNQSTGAITNHSWFLLTENTTLNQASPSRLYTSSGNYTVILTVSGPGGNSVPVDKVITIAAAPVATTRQYLPNVPFSTMVQVKGGTFQMGDTRNEGNTDEKPVRSVTVSDFYMGQYEVTQRQWQAVMGNNPSAFKGCDDCPVEQVSWNDAQAFLTKLNQQRPTGTPVFRLPTEAEWEYAAGGGAIANRTRFGNGKDIANSNEINYDGVDYSGRPSYSDVGIYRGKTMQVGSFSPNILGLYDMSGNVWEWCQDWYGAYSSGSTTNPTGPSNGTYRVLRGGSFAYKPQQCRLTYRSELTSTNIFTLNFGFRVVSQVQ